MNWTEDDWARLGAALRTARQHRGLSQKDVARAADVSIVSVLTAEAGRAPKARMPYTIPSIARALGWPAGAVEAVLDGQDPQAPAQAEELAARILALTPKQRAALIGVLDALENRT